MVCQFLKMDEATRKLIGVSLPAELTCANSNLNSPYLLTVDPVEFTHAYMLMGCNPSRFAYDLSVYLSTVNTFFTRSSPRNTIQIPNSTPDLKKRLSEDLGVGLASIFMVKALNIQWRSISQIPMNGKLVKKRPDFEGFDDAGKRHIFEAKGTTSPAGVETALGKAIEQVKGYPEDAESKLAIVSFFSTDTRLFDSETFIVDPPMPDIVPPDENTSVMLHYENVLKYAGFARGAVEYIKRLEKLLKEKQAIETGETVAYLPPPRFLPQTNILRDEIESANIKEFKNVIYRGQSISKQIDGRTYEMFLGISEDLINKIDDLSPEQVEPYPEWHDETVSAFSDGTIFEMQVRDA